MLPEQRFLRSTLFALLALLTGPLAGHSTVLQRLDLDDLTAQSSAVVHAEIVGKRAEWNESRNVIYTVYTVRPIEYLKGRLGPVFELHEPGGELDGLRMAIAAVPEFAVGQEAVLFVWTDARGKHQVIGFEQGSLAVRTDPQSGLKVVSRSVQLGSARTNDAAGGGPASSRFLPLLFQQIRASAAKAQQPGTPR